eukprot:3938965-Rhodomonas_salina.1
MQTDDVVRKKDVIVARTEKSDQHRTEIQQVRCACGAACGRSRLWRLMGRRWLVGAGQRPPDHDAARRRGRARDDRAGQDRGARPTPLRLCRACVAVQMYACVGCGRAVCGCARAADGGHVRGGQAQNKNNMLESELQQLAEHGNQRQCLLAGPEGRVELSEGGWRAGVRGRAAGEGGVGAAEVGGGAARRAGGPQGGQPAVSAAARQSEGEREGLEERGCRVVCARKGEQRDSERGPETWELKPGWSPRYRAREEELHRQTPQLAEELRAVKNDAVSATVCCSGSVRVRERESLCCCCLSGRVRVSDKGRGWGEQEDKRRKLETA